jgi:hypothetical protein
MKHQLSLKLGKLLGSNKCLKMYFLKCKFQLVLLIIGLMTLKMSTVYLSTILQRILYTRNYYKREISSKIISNREEKR